MTELIQPPAPGGDLEASWGAAVTEGVNRMEQMFPSGGLARQYAGGCGFAPLPANHRGVARTGGISPFAVRYVEENEDAGIPYTGFEIYLPQGCVNCGKTCNPINPKAYRLNGDERTDLDGWYRFSVPDNAENVNVAVHAKRSSMLTGIDTFNDAWWTPNAYLWAEGYDISRSRQDAEEDTADVGDDFSSIVGLIFISSSVGEDGETKVTIRYTQTVRNPLSMTCETGREFTLLPSFTVNEDDLSLEFDRLFIRNSALAAGGATQSTFALTEIPTTSTAVYVKVDTSGVYPVGIVIGYEDAIMNDGSTMTVDEQIQQDRGENDVMVLVYTLKNGKIVSDSRRSAANIQIYAP